MNIYSSQAWLTGFIIAQCASVGLLAVESLSSFRFVLRLMPFVISIFYLLILRPNRSRYPLRAWALAGFFAMSLGLFHPEANTFQSGLAQIALTLAVWSPVFWAGRLSITVDDLRRVVLYLWLFNVISSGIGVLQVYYPGRFAIDPSFVKTTVGESLDGLKIKLDDGTELFRPMGLSDTPGGAALAANSAIVMGIGLALITRSLLLKVAVAFGSVVAVFCLFICQVRSLLILTIISVVCMLILTAARGRGREAIYVATVASLGALLGFAWVISVGETAVIGRFDTLFEASATEVYYNNRGVFVEQTFYESIPAYPFGAGLGRWGMMHFYFGDSTMPTSRPIWAEVTFTGWVYDGGVLLVLIGYGAMLTALVLALRIALRHPSIQLSNFANVVVGISVAAFATTISAHIFVAQSGMMYLLMNALLYAAANPVEKSWTERRPRTA
jgi:hypothetical protein